MGWYTTHLFLAALTDGSGATLLIGFLLQLVLTWGERPLWYGRGVWYNGLLLLVDSIINVGGVYIYMTRLNQTDSWQAFAQGLGLSGDVNPLMALILSTLIGVLMAATPEFLWRQD
jgi:hypothetical protein